MTKKRNAGPIWLFLAALFWSVIGLLTKNVPWNGFAIGIGRGTVAFFFMLALFRYFPRKLTKIKLATAVCYFMQGLLFVAANRYTTAANATVLQNTSPIYIIIVTSLVAKKLPARRDVLTCAAMLIGVGLACLGSAGSGGALGNALALISALFYAGVYFCSTRPGADTAESTMIGNLFYVVLFPFLFLSPEVRGSDLRVWLFVIALGVSVTVAWLCFAKGIKTTDALQANFITMLEPVMSPIWTFLFLHETMSATSLIGCVIVVLTLLVYYATAPKKSEDSENENTQGSDL